MKNNKVRIYAGLGVMLVLSVIVVMKNQSTYAATANTNVVINAVVSETITISSSLATVSVDVTPTTSGAISTAAHNITVNTNASAGYNLTLASSTANRNLTSGSNTIAPISGTMASPVVLANNTWGYRVDSVGGFGTGSAVVTNQASSTQTFAGVPATGSADTIKSTSAPALDEITAVYYGVRADSTKPSGTYTNTVTYTATTR